MQELKITTSVEVSASAASAWKLFGEEFGDWSAWAPGIDSSELQGPLEQGVIRINRAESLGTVSQELVEFSPEQLSLAYEMRDGLPPYFAQVRNDWKISAVDGNRCRLEGEALFVLKDEALEMREKIEGKMGVVLEVFAKAFAAEFAGPG